MKLSFYIAGPMTGYSDQTYRNDIRAIVANMGHEFYDPSLEEPLDYFKGCLIKHRGKARSIIQRDETHIRKCDVLVGFFPRPTEGAAMELSYAHSVFMPTIAIIPENRREISAFLFKADVLLGSIKDFDKFIKNEKKLTKLLNKYTSH